MTFFGRRRPSPLDPALYRSVEEYAVGLMLAGTETETARELLRAAVALYRAQEERTSSGTGASKRRISPTAG
ncbi:MAG: hypothetical protein ACLP01_08070 [Solirubrobacteraceae bacterium]